MIIRCISPSRKTAGLFALRDARLNGQVRNFLPLTGSHRPGGVGKWVQTRDRQTQAISVIHLFLQRPSGVTLNPVCPQIFSFPMYYASTEKMVNERKNPE